jgi:glycosyltransferase involved in cell wall biosynthesis
VAAAGLPLVASRLQGLIEAVDDGVTGFLFTPGDHVALAGHLASLLDNEALRTRMAAAARARVLARYSLARQREALVEVIQRVRLRRG